MSTELYPGRRVLFGPGYVPCSFETPPSGLCCEAMGDAMRNDCAQHDNPFDCPDVFVGYSPAFNEFGLLVRDGTPSCVTISFCPWCGSKLPASLRDRWFADLEARGIEADLFSDDIPEAYKTAAWWHDT